jgi:hypothetical protein
MVLLLSAAGNRIVTFVLPVIITKRCVIAGAGAGRLLRLVLRGTGWGCWVLAEGVILESGSGIWGTVHGFFIKKILYTKHPALIAIIQVCPISLIFHNAFTIISQLNGILYYINTVLVFDKKVILKCSAILTGFSRDVKHLFYILVGAV